MDVHYGITHRHVFSSRLVFFLCYYINRLFYCLFDEINHFFRSIFVISVISISKTYINNSQYKHEPLLKITIAIYFPLQIAGVYTSYYIYDFSKRNFIAYEVYTL